MTTIDKLFERLSRDVADVFASIRAKQLAGKIILTADTSRIVRFLGCYSGKMIVRKQNSRRALVKIYSFHSETGEPAKVEKVEL